MEETPRPRPVRRDASAPIPLPEDDGETRMRRSTARRSAAATREADAVDEPRDVEVDRRDDEVDRRDDDEADRRDDRGIDRSVGADGRPDAAPAEVVAGPQGRSHATDRIRTGGATVERVQVQRPALGKRERRGATIAGALGLPLVTLGLITLAVPIGAWYVTTVFKSVLMAVAALFASEARVRELDQSITAVDPTSLGNVSFWLIVAGAVLLLGGLLLSWLVLRAHGVFHPMLVTLTAVPMAIGLSFLLQAGAGALAGLVFQLGDGGVSAIIANALFALLLFLVASVVIAVAVGIGVWLWMASVFRATVVTGAPGSVGG